MTVTTERGVQIRVPAWLFNAILGIILTVIGFVVKEVVAQVKVNTARLVILETQEVAQEKLRSVEIQSVKDMIVNVQLITSRVESKLDRHEESTAQFLRSGSGHGK